jgi:PAS domain S-box-containing protein
MRRVFHFLNPLDHLGERQYSVWFPLVVILATYIASEVVANIILRNPAAVGIYVIFISVALIIYFSFREGLTGGLIAAVTTVLYYFYIIYTRHYKGQELRSGVDTTIMLGAIYLVLSLVIGWLKQRIDVLIEIQAHEKRRLQAIIQQLPVGVIITDAKGIVVQTNEKIDEIMGIKIPLGFAIGKDNLGIAKIDGQVINPAKSPLANALAKGKPVLGKEYIYERPDGKIAYLQVSSSPIHNRKRKIIAAASIISDVTAQKDLERQKDDFLSMASHELKTPITSMKMFIDLLARQKNSTKSNYFVDRIRDQSNRLKELTNDLLDVSRIQTGKLRFNKEVFTLSETIKDTIEGLQGTTKNHRILFIEKYKGTVAADRYRIYQVLINLISNAIKYSPQGDKVIITLAREKERVVVSVEDFGIGIDKEQQEKIFDKLYQVTDPEEKTFPGLGLGLYITKEIIERHKGKIWVISEKGKGSTFSFSLPLPGKRK